MRELGPLTPTLSPMGEGSHRDLGTIVNGGHCDPFILCIRDRVLLHRDGAVLCAAGLDRLRRRRRHAAAWTCHPAEVLIPAWTLVGLAASVTLFGQRPRTSPGAESSAAGAGLPRRRRDRDLSVQSLEFHRADGPRRPGPDLRLLFAVGDLPAAGAWTVTARAAPAVGLIGGIVGTFGTMASLFFAAYLDACGSVKSNSAPP